MKGWSDKVELFVHEDEIVFLKKLENKKISGLPIIVKFAFDIYKCELCSYLLFLQGEFEEKLNKLESESENEGGSSNFAKFLISKFLKILTYSALGGFTSMQHIAHVLLRSF